MKGIRVIDLTRFLSGDVDIEECRLLVQILHDYSAAIIRDPRVTQADNDEYIDMMERYYAQPYEARIPDQRPELGHQVGVSPPGMETAHDYRAIIARLDPLHRPHTPPLPKYGDPKERFFWRLGQPPAETDFPELNAEPVVPAAFVDEWAYKMDKWGHKMLATLWTLSEMLAIGLGLPRDTFTKMLVNGQHLLAPNGVDLNVLGVLGKIWNAFHLDINFLTIHGKSRFPGLRIWLRDGTSMTPKVPDGCLLVQVGEQLEWMTSGYFQAGFHEVVCLRETLEAMEWARAAGRRLIRISSTVFAAMASDLNIGILPYFLDQLPPEARTGAQMLYPTMKVGEMVRYKLVLHGFIKE